VLIRGVLAQQYALQADIFELIFLEHPLLLELAEGQETGYLPHGITTPALPKDKMECL